jgi:hypothetical protein
MAFLDNSGDIILDAVLTDTGRLRLARGDGSFKIAKFVLADDEINYGLYDKNNASGSAYYDLDILQTPIFEAFTNNTSVVKSPLLSISRTNLLYLPVMKLNTKTDGTGNGTDKNTIVGTALNAQTNLYLVATDTNTETNTTSVDGKFNGVSKTTPGHIRVDQGLDTTEINAGQELSSFLNETQYIVEIDNRLGTIIGGGSSTSLTKHPSFIDDDNIASYYFSLAAEPAFVEQILSDSTSTSTLSANQIIAGPRGTCLGFQIAASNELQNSTYLFTTLGSTYQIPASSGNYYYYIDTNIVIRGVTTGSSITIPVRFIKKV